MSGTILVAWDLSDVLEKMVDTLAQLGHTKIGAIMPYSGMYMRYELFEAALRRHGLEPGESSCAWPSEGNDALGDIAPVIRMNSGIVTTPSGLEPLVSQRYASGLSWPDDISIITTTGSSEGVPQQGARRFTYLQTPQAPIGQAATQMLSKLIQGHSIPETARVFVLGQWEMSLVNLEGGSVGAPRAVYR
jgi:DNA-binding LacI/PurR family transcriptional regulator